MLVEERGGIASLRALQNLKLWVIEAAFFKFFGIVVAGGNGLGVKK